MNMVEVGKRIKQTIKKQKLTQKWVSDATGIPQSSLSDVMKGKNNGSVEKYIQIAKILNVDLHWLIWGETYEEMQILSKVAERESAKKYNSEKRQAILVKEILDIVKELEEPELDLIKEMAIRFKRKK